MSRVTRFAARDSGPVVRVAGFIAHLRANGLSVGVAEADLALSALLEVNAILPHEARRALRAVCVGCVEEAQRFDDLFDSYWMDMGRVRQKVVPTPSKKIKDNLSSSSNTENSGTASAGNPSTPDAGDNAVKSDLNGKLIATKNRSLDTRDLRDLVRPEEIIEAEEIARRIGEALKHRRSRRRIAALKGDRIHFRKMFRCDYRDVFFLCLSFSKA